MENKVNKDIAENTVYKLFETQVEINPKAIALVFKDKSITYEELNSKSNKIARILKQKLSRKDETIGVFCNRSIEMVEAIIAILKSGAAFLPIDPEFPKERIEFMLRDSKTEIILTNNKEYSLQFPDYNTFNVDSEEQFFKEDNTNLGVLNAPEDLAYVIYTSGSTGKPKGVMIEHKSVINFFTGVKEIIDFSTYKKIIALTTISFDIFVLEILLPLAYGLTVVLADENSQKNPKLLSNLIIDNEIDMLQMTPSRMQLLINHDKELKCLRNLKEIMIGGEAFPKSILEKLNSHTNAKIYNMYGPTETTIWSTISNLTGKDCINIGKPIINTQLFIVDENNNLVPDGAEGELCIGGFGLARGYMNSPNLTEERFISSPFIPGERIYKTGDMVRRLPDGNIEYLGRIDFQVKVRGFRIELGEIEGILLKHKSVKQAVVTAWEGKENIKYLCAYIVSDEELLPTELREHLRNNLPDYMIPERYIRLDSLPQTPNGKIDRKSLPAPETIPNFEGSEKLTLHEEVSDDDVILSKIKEIFKEYLDASFSIDSIDLNSNLIDLGINSVTFIKIVVTIETEFEFNFGDEDLDADKFPTVISLMNYIKSRATKWG